jgi:hypothetical protein
MLAPTVVKEESQESENTLEHGSTRKPTREVPSARNFDSLEGTESKRRPVRLQRDNLFIKINDRES